MLHNVLLSLAHDVFILMYLFLWVVYVRGDTLFYVFISIIVSCFTCVTLAIDLYYEVMICVFYFSIL